MFIAVSVGHQKVLGVIPVSFVDVDKLRPLVPDLIQRLAHLVKGRVQQFDYTIMGSKIIASSEHRSTEDHALVADTIHAAVRFAQFTNHDHISISMVGDLWETLDRHQRELDGKLSLDRRYDAHQIPLQGIDLLYIQELSRLERLKERVTVGISNPLIQW